MVPDNYVIYIMWEIVPRGVLEADQFWVPKSAPLLEAVRRKFRIV